MKIKLFTKKYPLEGDLQHSYSPLKNILTTDGSIVDFNTTELSVDLNNPLSVECQPSYDGTVNLIINDDKNPPRIVNSRFTTTEDGRYRIINRNQVEQTNLYKEGKIDLQTRLFRNVSKIPHFDLIGLNFTGRLRGGNYTFYVKYADSDENETDVVCESGQISVFKGSLFNVSSITGTLYNEETDKSIKLKLNNIDTSFSKLYIYYSRETSDQNGFRISETYKITNPFDIVGTEQFITINGYEQVEQIDQSGINIKYNLVTNVKTQAQVQNMLFFGNVQGVNVDVKNLQNISYFFEVQLKQKEESIGWIDPETYETSVNSPDSCEYYDPKNIYYNLGYWPGEIYRLGVVYVMNDDSLSPVFNLRGCQFDALNQSNFEDSPYKINGEINYLERDAFVSGERPFTNTYGVFKNPDQTKDTAIHNYDKLQVKPWFYQISISQELQTELSNFGVKGYFFVRQRRIPITLCQGLSVGIDSTVGIPSLYDGSKFIAESFIHQETGELSEDLSSRITSVDKTRIKGSGLLSLDASVHPTMQSNLDGSKFTLQKIFDNPIISSNNRVYSYSFQETNNNNSSLNCIYINENVPYKYVNNYGFSTRVGSELLVKEFGLFGATDSEREKTSKAKIKNGNISKFDAQNLYTKLVRGIYTPFIGVCGNLTPGALYNIRIQNYSTMYMKDYMEIRGEDHSEFYAISDRYGLTGNEIIHDVYRGDCFTNTVTMRINRNFNDPDYPINDTIVDKDTWWKNYLGLMNTPEIPDSENEKNYGWAGINRADVNAVPLGMWVTYKCLSSYNLGLRSEDTSWVDEQALYGNPRSFYPHHDASPKSAYKIEQSFLLNDGFSATVGQRYNIEASNVPYLKDQFDNRIMFSNIQEEGGFKNGYRIFQGLSYKDIDRQYGAIVKLLPWGTNLFCVFEHGLAVLPVNEKALIQTSTEQSIHMYGAGVLQNQVSLISPDFGSIWPESVIRTPIGIYGVDTFSKKIWRYTDTKGFETLSDLKVQRFLHDNIKLKEKDKYPTISLKNVKTHYNNYKGDVMFTFYNNNENVEWNLCFNERIDKWVTKYSWTPLYSENIDNTFCSMDKTRSELLAHIYNNKNTEYGIRTSTNEWGLNEQGDLKDIFETTLTFVGDTTLTDFDIKIDKIYTSYMRGGYEINYEFDNKDLFNIEKISPNEMKLSWKKSDLEYLLSVRIPLYYKIETTVYPIYGDKIGNPRKEVLLFVVDYHYDDLAYSELLGNGVFVHGRSGVFDEIDYFDEDPDNQIKPTKWYNKQEPFEFEFVVNEPVGLHKIIDNLVIISNSAQPKSIEFEIIGDVYDFKKSGLLKDTEFKNDNVSIKFDPILNQRTLVKEQECKNVNAFGRRLGNIHYKEDAWYLTIEPIVFKNKKVHNWSSARIRDKFVKVRVKYSGEDQVLITAIKSLINITSA